MAPFRRDEPGSVHGPTHARETVECLWVQFPDPEMTIESLVADPVDDRGWSIYGAERAQPVATGGKAKRPENDGKECDEEGPPAESCSARPRETKGGPTQCCMPDWISVASVSIFACSIRRARRSRGAAPPDADGLRGLAARLARFAEPVQAAIESMNGARFVHDQLEQAGWEVEIADAVKVKGLAPLACKTDRIDARVLAELARRDLVPSIWLPDPQVRADRELARLPFRERRSATTDHFRARNGREPHPIPDSLRERAERSLHHQHQRLVTYRKQTRQGIGDPTAATTRDLIRRGRQQGRLDPTQHPVALNPDQVKAKTPATRNATPALHRHYRQGTPLTHNQRRLQQAERGIERQLAELRILRTAPDLEPHDPRRPAYRNRHCTLAAKAARRTQFRQRELLEIARSNRPKAVAGP